MLDRPPADSKNSIQVIDRMMLLLDVLVASGEPVALKALAQQTGLHTSTAHRILNVMVGARLVDRNEPGNYRLGMRLMELGNIVKSRIDVRQVALPFMRELHAITGETVNLSVRQDDEIIYVERTASARTMMRVVQVIGARAPLHITAAGKLYLCEDDPARVKAYAERSHLTPYTVNSLRTLAALTKELLAVRGQGYALDQEEAELGVRCIAAGVYDDTGALCAGLSVSAPMERSKLAWASEIKVTAAKVSEALGFEKRRL